MKNINYKLYVMESSKITLLCLFIVGLFYLSGSSHITLLVVFNMAVMSSAATFSIDDKHIRHVILGSGAIISSIVVGGMIGFYCPTLAKIFTVLFATFAFYFPKTKYKLQIFAASAVVFLIFSALPFDLITGMWYAFDGVVVFLIFVIFDLFSRWSAKKKPVDRDKINHRQIENNHTIAFLAALSLSLSWLAGEYLTKHFHFSHLYWIGLTALLVIQGSERDIIKTAIKRMGVNFIGAVFVVVLFNYIMPPYFLPNFLMLVVFLFLIFSLSFSYVGRVLFIELFVLSFTHLFGDYQNAIAVDRIVMTLVGGFIVILSVLTIITYKKLAQCRSRRGT